MKIETYQGDQLAVQIPVTHEGGDLDGQAVDLTGATVEVSARRRGLTVTATATLADAVGGVIEAEFAPGDLDKTGQWRAQARVTLAGVPQTVAAFEILVTVSIF